METLNYILDHLVPIEYFTPGSRLQERMPVEIPNYDREDLTHLFKELGFKRGVEIGVRGGEYSEMICLNNPGVEVFGIDPYEPHEGYHDIQRRSTFNKYWVEAQLRLSKFPNYAFIKEYSETALKVFKDNSLDFVYIDGDHSFYQVAFDIEFWSKKVRPGGIICGDDYFKHRGHSNIDVYQVVNAYTDAKVIRPWFVLGRNAEVEGERRDHGRSWMWIK